MSKLNRKNRKANIFQTLKLLFLLFDPSCIFVGKTTGGIGDALMTTAQIRLLKNRFPKKKIVVETKYPELFVYNPCVYFVVNKHIMKTKRHIKRYYIIDSTHQEHILKQVIKSTGLEVKEFDLQLDLFFSEEEIKWQKENFEFPYISICPSGKQDFCANRKEWGIDNFQKVVNAFPEMKFVQIGTKEIHLLENVIDRRGLPIRKSAGIIKQSLFFLGLEGGLMHLANAVHKPAVIIYGGLILPESSAYPENITIYNKVDCSPCYISYKRMTNCPSMKCMKGISSKLVTKKIKEMLKKVNYNSAIDGKN
jgi:ADP-heptose:LPS heptosyltransferase